MNCFYGISGLWVAVRLFWAIDNVAVVSCLRPPENPSGFDWEVATTNIRVNTCSNR